MTLDITERQLRVALRNVPVPMLAHDETGRIRFLSDTLLSITGYTREQLPTFRAWLELAYGDPAVVERVVEAHRGGYGDLGGRLPQGGEYRVRTASGATRVWRFKAYSIGRDEEGLAVNVSMAVDVTAERASLDALARSEAILRQAIRVGGVGSFERHFGDRVTLLSEELASLLGLPGDARREPFEAFYARVHPEDRGRVVAYVEDLANPDAPLATEYRVIRPSDGAVRIIAERRELQRDAEARAFGCVGLQRDVTDARAAEEALRVSEERLRLSLELGQVGTFDWNLIDNTLMWDSRTKAIWGLDEDAPVTVEVFFNGLHPDDLHLPRTAISRSHDTAGDGLYEVDYRVLNARDGQVRHVSARGRTLFANGRAVRMMGVVVDVTTLREAAAVLERDRKELEALVEARTRELAEAQTRLAHAQRMDALGHLAGGIAHDFNNVLQAIEAAADLIERRPEPEHLPRYLRMAREATKRGSAISRRLSSLSRRSELEPEPVALDVCLEAIAAVVRRTSPASLVVEVDCPQGTPLALADRRQLETALLNLAANAREAMDETGRLTLRARSGAQAQDARFGVDLPPGEFVRIEVEDTGRGMDADVRARAAEPFFTTKPRGQGVGLGLSMARGFAEQSGGALAIASEPGRGATVALWLPVVGPARAATPAPAFCGQHGRLLVVDDDPLVRELLGEQLRLAGYEVAAFAEGRAALAAMNTGLTPDLLLTDFAMPEMNGVELARAVRRLRPALPVAVLTGFAGEAADACGQDDFTLLRKPIDGDALVLRVAGLLKAAGALAD